MRTALVAGASGLVGRHLLGSLLTAPEYDRVIVLVRRSLNLPHPKLVEVVGSFQALDRLPGALRGDDAFSALGTTRRQAGSRAAFRAVDHGAVLAFAWAAQRGGARRFYFVSALGADPAAWWFYPRVKGETEQALQVLGFDALGLFRPSLLLGTRAEPRRGERAVGTLLRLVAPLLVGRWRRYRPVSAAGVARAMVRVAGDRRFRGVRVLESDEIESLGAPTGASPG